MFDISFSYCIVKRLRCTPDYNMNTYIIIPIFNEATVIESVLKEVQSHGYSRIIVVDDGSQDDTRKLLQQRSDIIFIRHALNRGKGAAVRTGMEASKLLDADFVITLDGDGQHNPEDIAKMQKKFQEGCQVVLGSRLMKASSMPWYKTLHNYLGNLFVWMLYGLWVTDSQSGFRGYTKEAMQRIDTKTDRYEYDSEVIREIARNKLSFVEVPIEVRYTKYSMGKAQKMNLKNGIKTACKMFFSNT